MTTTEVTIEIVCNILGKVKVRFEIQDLWLPKILAYLFYVQYGMGHYWYKTVKYI